MNPYFPLTKPKQKLLPQKKGFSRDFVTSLKVMRTGQAHLKAIMILAQEIESHHPCHVGHGERVAGYAQCLGEALHWSPAQLQALNVGARLHDIGKILLPMDILQKPSPLSENEWRVMKQHPVLGVKILRKISHLKEALPYILFHHEKWDGSGYPFGLLREEIPVQGRVLAIADVFDALTTARSYRPAWSLKDVIQFMQRGIGTYFDPYWVGVFFDTVLPRYIVAQA